MIYGYLDPSNRTKANRVYALTMVAGGKILPMGAPIPKDTNAIIFNGILRGGGELYREIQSHNIPYYCIDNGYFGENTLRITKNNWTNWNIVDRPSDRSPNIEMEEWRTNGDYVLILPPSKATQFAMFGEKWLEETLDIFKDHKVKVREKPPMGQLGVGLEEDLSGAYMVASHSSKILVEAMCKGIPTWTTHGATREVSGLTDFDRTRVINHLSYAQFTFEEIHNGFAWSVLNED